MALVQTIEDGARNLIIKVDGAGAEASTQIVDASSLNPPCESLSLLKVQYSLDPASSMQIQWDATAATVAWNLFGSSGNCLDFCDVGGIPNNAGAGKTGDVLLSTDSTTAYSLYLHFIKRSPVYPK